MKNAIQYYYHLNPDILHQIDGVYRFTIHGIYYAVYPYQGDFNEIKAIYQLSLKILEKGLYCHQIILNIENNLMTNINGNSYILLQSYESFEGKITLEHIIQFSNATLNLEYSDILRRDNWSKLWGNKIDYFEYQLNQFGKSHPVLRESLSYFSGITEIGISFFNQLKLDYKSLCISHKRIKKNYTLYELYNPLNFIIDTRVRDVCEYFKESFVRNKNILNDIVLYIKESSLTNYELCLFMARMLYPTFYYDLYEQVIVDIQNEQQITPIVQIANEYEQLLKNIYDFIGQYVLLPDIEWFKKM